MIGGAAVSDSLHSEVNMPAIGYFVLLLLLIKNRAREPNRGNSYFQSSFFLMQQIHSHHLNHNREEEQIFNLIRIMMS
ncbi:unnamed protein product [Sphagnum compactum]